jgi:hypothetical protein
MSVVNVKPSGSGRSAGGGDSRSMTEVWTVLTDDPADGPLVVQRDPRIPRKGDPHPKDTWLRAGYPDVAAVGNSLILFQVTVTYQRAAGATDNPLLVPPQRRRGYVQTSKVFVGFDYRNQPILNTAGDPFEPPVTVDAYLPTLTVTRNEERDPQWAQVLIGDGAVNLDPFDGWKPGHALLKPPAAAENRESSVVYWEVTWEIVYSWDGWSPLWVANMGRRELQPVGAGGKLGPMWIKDAGGDVVGAPVWLLKDGRAAGKDDLRLYVGFDTYRALPFSQFHLVPNRGGGAPVTMRKLK